MQLTTNENDALLKSFILSLLMIIITKIEGCVFKKGFMKVGIIKALCV